jgi:hypothetical protein
MLPAIAISRRAGDYMIEEWKESGYDEYLVSNTGKIKSLKFGRERVLKPRFVCGYAYVILSNGPNRYSLRVHRIVARVFHGPPPSKSHEVNHIDGNKANNHSNNLEWVTPSQNVRHSFDELGRIATRGENVVWHRLDEKDVREIRQDLADGLSLGKIAKARGVARSTIQSIKDGRNWAWLQ